MNTRSVFLCLLASALVLPLAGASGPVQPVHATGRVVFSSTINDCYTDNDTITFDMDTEGDVTIVDTGIECGSYHLVFDESQCTGTAQTDIVCTGLVSSPGGQCRTESHTVFLGTDGYYEQRFWVPNDACDGTWSDQTTVRSATVLVRI